MATQTLEFSAGTGLTLSCKLFALGSDTVVDTQTASEKTNDKNRYSVAFANVPAGAYRMNAFVGATGGFANEIYDLTLTTATFYPREEAAAGGIDAGVIADAVWDESYNQHTTAGSFGKLMDLLRKSNMVLEATVQASPTPTATTFNVTGLSYPTGAFEHAVLFFADDATLAEQNSPILTFVNNGNGTQTIVLEEARTAAPVAGDKVLIDATSHVHAIADIQSGLALQTTSLAIKAKTDLITTDTVFITVDRVAGSTITMHYNESTTATVPLDEDTTSLTLRFVVENSDQLDVLVIENANITRTASNFTVLITTAVTATLGQYRWALRDITGGINRLIEGGVLQVISAANKDA
jgi:hypothetical protein